MSATPETTGTEAEEGFLKLYDFDGNPMEVAREDLLSIEGKSFDEPLHRRVVNDVSGHYWLISDRPGYCPMLLQVSVFRCYPREEGHVKWSISYCTNGVASYPHFKLESAIKTFQREPSPAVEHLDPNDYKPLPENVANIAREHVAYRLGKEPGTDPLDRHGIKVRDAVDIREHFTQYFEGAIDPTKLMKNLSGRRVPIFELLLAIELFCSENDLSTEEHGDAILNILIPEDQQERFAMLAGTLAEQLGGETDDMEL